MKRLRRSITVGLGAFLLVAVVAGEGSAYRRPGRIELGSVAHDGSPAEAFFGSSSYGPRLSPDGRYLMFFSYADNLVPHDGNEKKDVFLRDLRTGEVERISEDAQGSDGSWDSLSGHLTPDARFVTFESYASNWMPDAGQGRDVFLKDRRTGALEQISVSTSGALGNGESYGGSMSDDGRYVVFDSVSTNLVAGADANNSSDVFLRDRQLGTTTRLSEISPGVQANGGSGYSAITGDGRHVIFTTGGSNYVAGDSNGATDVYVLDRTTGAFEAVSVGDDGSFHNGQYAGGTSISEDGRYVAFASDGSNLVPHDTNGADDVFVRDRLLDTTRRVSVSSAGVEANGDYSALTGISPDGRFVTFFSDASNLVSGDAEQCDDFGVVKNCRDVFIHDLETGITQRLSETDQGEGGDGWSWESPNGVSNGGEVVAFMSHAENLVPEDDNGGTDIFVRRRGPAVGPWNVDVRGQGAGIAISGDAGFAGADFAEVTDGEDATLAPIGADLRRARLTYRREAEDILLRLELSSLPSAPTDYQGSIGGAPAVLYGMSFQAAGASYEIRILPLAGSTDAPFSSRVALYHCNPTCTHQAALSGSVGVTGREVRVAIPLSALPVGEGGTLSSMAAFTMLADPTGAPQHELDDLHVGTWAIPTARVEIGVAPWDAAPEQVAFDTVASLQNGGFSASRGAAAPPGSRLWVRACLGSVCGVTSRPPQP